MQAVKEIKKQMFIETLITIFIIAVIVIGGTLVGNSGLWQLDLQIDWKSIATVTLLLIVIGVSYHARFKYLIKQKILPCDNSKLLKKYFKDQWHASNTDKYYIALLNIDQYIHINDLYMDSENLRAALNNKSITDEDFNKLWETIVNNDADDFTLTIEDLNLKYADDRNIIYSFLKTFKTFYFKIEEGQVIGFDYDKPISLRGLKIIQAYLQHDCDYHDVKVELQQINNKNILVVGVPSDKTIKVTKSR